MNNTCKRLLSLVMAVVMVMSYGIVPVAAEDTVACSHENATETGSTAATCTVDGAKTFKCGSCEYEWTQVIPASGHSYTEEVTTAATCTDDGVKTFTCGNCGDSYTETISAAGHSYSENVTTAATCTTDGEKTFTCGTCGDTYTETITATGHSYTEAVTTAATCTTEGVKTFTCGNCGDSYTEAIPAGHTYVDGACSACGAEEPHTHSYGEGAVTREATCTAEGELTFTCDCGDTYTEAIEMLAHDYKDGKCACGELDYDYDWCGTLGCDVENNVHHAECPFGPCTLTPGCQLVKGHEQWGAPCDVAATFAAVAKIGDKDYDTLQTAIDEVGNGQTITLVTDVSESVKITQQTDVVFTIDGNSKTFTGVMTVFGNGRKETAGLTIKNVNFVAASGADSCIVSPDRSVNNAYSYATNVTVSNCTFTDADGSVNCAAIRTEDGGDKNWTVTGCSVDSTMHSLLQVQNIEGKLTVTKCTVNSKNGINLNSTTNVEITDCNFNVKGYAVRGGVSSGGNPDAEKNYVLNNNTMNSECNDGDAVIMLRSSAANVDIDMAQNKVTGTTHISGTTEDTDVTANANYWGEGLTGPVVSGEPVEVDTYYPDAAMTATKEAPKGTLTKAYANADGYWGECGGNAKESFVFKFYYNDTYMGYTSLNNVDGIIDGDVNVTWNMKFDAASNTDEYWTMAWDGTAPTLEMQPNRVEQWVDGFKVAECPIELNWADNIFPVVAVVSDDSGKILKYINNYQGNTLAAAFAEGGNITLLADVNESITIGKATVLDGNGRKVTGDILVKADTTIKGNLTVAGTVNAGYGSNKTGSLELTIADNFTANSIYVGDKTISGYYTNGEVHKLTIQDNAVINVAALYVRPTCVATVTSATVNSGDLYVRGSMTVNDSNMNRQSTVGGGTGHWAIYEDDDATKTASLTLNNSTVSTNYIAVGSDSNSESDANSNAKLTVNGGSLTLDKLYVQGKEGAFEKNVASFTNATVNAKSAYLHKKAATNVYGECTINIAAITGGNTVDFQNGAIIKDSTIAGNVYVLGKVTFRGANTFAMLYDYGAAYSNPGADWTVEPGASVTLTNTGRYGLGYGDKVTIQGSVANALSDRGNVSASLSMHGMAMMCAWDEKNYLTVEDAYVVIGNNNSFGTKGDYGDKGDFYVVFDNSILDSSRVTVVNGGGAAYFTFNGSDAKMGAWHFNHATSTATFTDSKMLVTGNGTDYNNANAGTMTLVNSDLEFQSGAFTNNGILSVDKDSTFKSPQIIGTGTIVIDAEGMNAGPLATITGDVTGFTGKLEVENNDALVAKIVADENTNTSYIELVEVAATVDNVPYVDIQEAINNADGKTVVVMNNLTVEDLIVIAAGKTVTIDLNEKTLTTTGIMNYGNLTVSNGKIVDNDFDNSAVENNGANASLTIDDVEITSPRHAVRVDGGKATIKSGKFATTGTAGKTTHALNVSDGATVTVEGGEFIGAANTAGEAGQAVMVQANSTVNISGGDFKGGKDKTLRSSGTLTLTGGTYDQDPTEFCAKGYGPVLSDGKYVVTVLPASGDDTFTSLDEALGDEVSSVKIPENPSFEQFKEVNGEHKDYPKALSIDANGNVITGTGYISGDNAIAINNLTAKNHDVLMPDGGKVSFAENGTATFTPNFLEDEGYGRVTVTDKNGKTRYFYLDSNVSLTVAANGALNDSDKHIIEGNKNGPTYNIQTEQNTLHDREHYINKDPNMIVYCNGFYGSIEKIWITGGQYGTNRLYIYENGKEQVDDIEVDPGCTIVTLKKDYLNDLDADDDYYIHFQYMNHGKNDSVSTRFKVLTTSSSVADETNPKTGDFILMPMAIMTLSAAALAVLLIGKKKHA